MQKIAHECSFSEEILLLENANALKCVFLKCVCPFRGSVLVLFLINIIYYNKILCIFTWHIFKKQFSCWLFLFHLQ